MLPKLLSSPLARALSKNRASIPFSLYAWSKAATLSHTDDTVDNDDVHAVCFIVYTINDVVDVR